MFDDLRLACFSRKCVISSPLQTKPSNSSKPVMHFSELTALNNQFNKPPVMPMTLRAKASPFPTSKIRSVSFIDFSEALTTVARISKFDEQCSRTNLFLKRLLKNNKQSAQIRPETRKFANSVPVVRKGKVGIFNYPMIRPEMLNSPGKPQEIRVNEEKIKVKRPVIPKKKALNMSENLEIVEKIEKRPDLVKRLEINRTKIRAKSSHNREKEGPKQENEKGKLFLKIREKISAKCKIITHNSKSGVQQTQKNGSQTSISNISILKKPESTIIHPPNLKARDDLAKHAKEISEEKTLLEPWVIQETFPEEIL